MFDNLKNFASLMGNAGELREKMERMQRELAESTVEADAGAGAVTVTMNGKFEVLAVRLDKVMIQTLAGEGADADQAMIEELIVSACAAAHAKVLQLIKEQTTDLTGGLNLPGLDQFLSGGGGPGVGGGGGA
jgi:DNA-binding YbaB/EbfC family protein